jgi:aquaporin Z
MPPSLTKRAVAEFFGTFWLVFGGCGAAIFAAAFPALGIGFAGVALAFGLTVLTMAYAIGHISGCHLNPAVTLGLVAGKRFPAKEILPYWLAQLLGGSAASGVLYVLFTARTRGTSAALRRTASVHILRAGTTWWPAWWRRCC